MVRFPGGVLALVTAVEGGPTVGTWYEIVAKFQTFVAMQKPLGWFGSDCHHIRFFYCEDFPCFNVRVGNYVLPPKLVLLDVNLLGRTRDFGVGMGQSWCVLVVSPAGLSRLLILCQSFLLQQLGLQVRRIIVLQSPLYVL